MRLTTPSAIFFVFMIAAVPAFAGGKVDLVRVSKAERRLELIGDGKVLRSYGIALGGDPLGHKYQEGDQRTPEGRYDWRNPNSIFHKSIHVSYPNADDLAAAKTRNVDAGGMIMIHGQPNGYGWWGWLLQLVDWTDGCIAVTDSDMDEIWAMVTDGTPIEIER
ncbi:L,D-transpeptidase family protein [Mesorhizobium sp. dw_380]|uniref:L,D-transpeptidase family protein n=1 Tax=Mesorhizobium sp. dw_380 TaxID=2812001 RepID=UPI001BDEC19E|nr:L,D-transpeptidase family protein [Mesorhizobium sp. dw_380]